MVDAVHRVAVARSGWPEVAHDTGAVLLTVLLTCRDRGVHQRRVAERRPDLAGQVMPRWESVALAEMEPWPDVRLELDTSGGARTVVDAVVDAVGRARLEALRQH